jgi:hypothetical protein
MRHILFIAVILTLIAGATLGAVGIVERANDNQTSPRSLVIDRGALADVHAFNINRDAPDLSVAGIPVAQNFRAE